MNRTPDLPTWRQTPQPMCYLGGQTLFYTIYVRTICTSFIFDLIFNLLDMFFITTTFRVYFLLHIQENIISSRFSIHSEGIASEFIENLCFLTCFFNNTCTWMYVVYSNMSLHNSNVPIQSVTVFEKVLFLIPKKLLKNQENDICMYVCKIRHLVIHTHFTFIIFLTQLYT